MKIGILALQGDYEKHSEILDELGLDTILIRYPNEIKDIDGLVIPGGESTTLTRLMRRMNFYNTIIEFAKEKPILGTCAGLILMAIRTHHELVKPLGLLDIEVDRNGYGRQIHSFTEILPVQLNNHVEKITATFIRAPKIVKAGKNVEILAESNGEICAVKQGKHIGLTFHPELNGVSIFHQLAFLSNSISLHKKNNMQLELLPNIKSPKDIKGFDTARLEQLCDEIREYTIDVVTNTGGHLAPTLGVVELTVALHHVFNTPEDKLVWDVGHQAYAHKILTGRFEAFKTNRQYKGLSGFLKRRESEYDVFGAGHASTSISAALGIAAARDHHHDDFRVCAIIGDGAMTGGLAYEGLNNAGHLRKQLLVILNDNEMSISPNVGAMRTYLTHIITNPLYNRVRDEIWKLIGGIPGGKKVLRTFLKKVEEGLKSMIVPGIIFDELGFRYFGPIDGHNMEEIVRTLNNIKDIKTPVLLHIITKRGKGW